MRRAHQALRRLVPASSCWAPLDAHPRATQPFFEPTTAFLRCFTNKPENTVYSGPLAQNPERVTLRTILDKHRRGERISMVTAYDYPSAVHVDRAGVDILLVGDSVGMVVHGHDTTLPVTLDDMLLHCKAVSRGAHRAFVVTDLPFGTYEADPQQAVHSAVRLLKEGHVDAVKLEGGTPSRVRAAAALVDAGIAVMGHCGLLPQSISALGGFRPQGQRAESAMQVLDQAKALEAAGCMGVVLECVPPVVGAVVTAELGIPTIGIGAGPATSGQVLVYHDLLGMMTHPHYTAVTPKFCKRYADVGAVIHSALQQYAAEVQQGTFPGPAHSPYRMAAGEAQALCQRLEAHGCTAGLQAVEALEQHDHSLSNKGP